MSEFFVNLWIALVSLFWPAIGGLFIGLAAAAYVKACPEPFNRTPSAESEDYRRLQDYLDATDNAIAVGNSQGKPATTLAVSRGQVVTLRKHIPVQHPAAKAGDLS